MSQKEREGQMMQLGSTDLNARIEKFRKGDFTIEFINVKGEPLVSKKVSYSMMRLAFDLGTVLYWSIFNRPSTDSNRKNYLERINTYFNTILIPIFWHCMEPEQGKFEDSTPMRIWQWCHDHEKATFGHAIFYGWDGLDDIDPADTKKPMIRPWVKALRKKELEGAMKARLGHVLTLFDTKISDFTLSNEMINKDPFSSGVKSDYYTKILGFENGTPYFKWAKAIAPNATFYLNENSIFAGNSTQNYIELIHSLMQAGAEVGGIGIQAHFFGETIPENEELWTKLEMLSQFGLPIKITEFGVRTRDAEHYAQDMQRFYRVCFAHPSVTGILRWGSWEPEMWPHIGVPCPEACLWQKDWSITPAGEAYIDLVSNEWNTQGVGELNLEGQLHFHGFFGRYRLEVDGRKYTVELTPGTREVAVIVD